MSGKIGWDASANAWIAAQGDEGDRSRREILDPALDQFFDRVEQRHVLDVGCGEGRYCRKLAKRGATVTGIDLTVGLLANARSKHPDGRYVAGNAACLPFFNQSFDFVLSYLSLVDIEDDLAAINEMCRVTKPGGVIVVVTVSNVASTSSTWVRDSHGNILHRAVDRYMECFPIELSWSGINIVNWHRPLSHTLGAFLAQGVRLTAFLEPLPAPGSAMYEDERRVPTFQIMAFASPH